MTAARQAGERSAADSDGRSVRPARNDEVPLCTTARAPKTVTSERERLSWPDLASIDEADDVFDGLTGGRLAIGRLPIEREIGVSVDRAKDGQAVGRSMLNG